MNKIKLQQNQKESEIKLNIIKIMYPEIYKKYNEVTKIEGIKKINLCVPSLQTKYLEETINGTKYLIEEIVGLQNKIIDIRLKLNN